MQRIPFDRVNWTTSSFLIGTALMALIGVPIYLIKFGLNGFEFALFAFYVTATMMSITVGYHRLFSHLIVLCILLPWQYGKVFYPCFRSLRFRKFMPQLGF